MSVKTHIDQTASCACSKSAITVKGPVWTTMLCTCTDCQKVSGAGHTAIAVVDPQSIKTEGKLKRFDRTADSGATFSRYFCPECGITLYGTTSRRDDVILLPVGLFADQSWYDPKQVIFGRSHKHWDTLPDIPTYDTYKENAQ